MQKLVVFGLVMLGFVLGYQHAKDSAMKEFAVMVEVVALLDSKLEEYEQMIQDQQLQLEFLDRQKIEVKKFRITAYTKNECHPWCDDLTASLKPPVRGRTVACPPDMPFGTKVFLPQIRSFTCEDRGSAIIGNRLDMYVDHVDEALQFGVKESYAIVLRKN